MLDGVSVSAMPGTITAVLGANGAGKTTLLRTISGFVRPRHGRVLVGGTNLARRHPEDIARAGVAHVPEGQGVITELTVEENLRLGALSNADKNYIHGTLPTWKDFVAHPNYDAFWKQQAFPRYFENLELQVPNLNVAGW